ncbi:MAG TPA: hypothetical protein VMF32_04320 [Xanthobacteraceae bacterium]|nr:hypothetical protein [Xanthobacteraceae bacterium]
MARRPGSRRIEESVLFDVLYEDGTQTSNRKVPASALEGLEGDEAAKSYLEEQDRKIAEMSRKPRGPIKSATRAAQR